MIRESRHIAQGIEETAIDKKSNLILAGWNGKSSTGDLTSTAIDPVIRAGPVDLALFKHSDPGKDWKRIIVGISGSPHGLLAAWMASLLGDYLALPVRFVYIMTHGVPMDQDTAAIFLTRTARPDPIFSSIEPEIYYADSVIEKVLEIADEEDLLILGAGRETYFERRLFGRDSHEIARRFNGAVMLVKKYEGKGKTVVQGLFQPLEESNPVLVDAVKM
jgi:hypothetical protein